MKPKITRALLIFIALLSVGSIGYYLLLDINVIDALYMTVITISTVGYSEIAEMNNSAKIFSMFLILSSIGTVGYVISTVVSYLFEGDVQKAWRERKMKDSIAKLSDHFIICGGGDTAQYIIEALQNNTNPYVVIDDDKELIEELSQQKILAVHGDATSEDTLKKLHIDKAKGVIAALPKDADNLFVVLTARGLNPKTTIIAKCVDASTHDKLLGAGADKTVSPTEIGGRRMAAMLTRPAVISFLDTMTHAGDLDLGLEQVTIQASSDLCGKMLRDSKIPERTGLIVLAIQNGTDNKMNFNPRSTALLNESDKLIVMGAEEDVKKLRQIAS